MFKSYMMSGASGDVKPKKYSVIFVLGGPGSGKGTQCANISKIFGYIHLSAGDLLRAEKDRPNSEFGALIIKYIKEGKIVPVEITCSLIENAMRESGKYKFLIDGFPRNKNNLDGWNKTMADKVIIDLVLYIDCSETVCVKRCLGRGTGRDDDNEETLKKRLVQFKEECKPIIDHFNNENLVLKVNGDLSVDEVFTVLEKKFSTLQ